jgi:hypothetical protein
MESLFRFAHVRPSIEPDEKTPPVQLTQPSDLQRVLGATHGQREARKLTKAPAAAYVGSPAYAPSLECLPIGKTLKRLAEVLERQKTDAGANQAQVAAAVQAVLNGAAVDFMTRGEVMASAARQRDTIVTIKLLPEEYHRHIEKLTLALPSSCVQTRCRSRQPVSRNSRRSFGSAQPSSATGDRDRTRSGPVSRRAAARGLESLDRLTL